MIALHKINIVKLRNYNPRHIKDPIKLIFSESAFRSEVRC